MVKFVESDTTGLPLKRKQVAQACEKCRRRKKRCVHADPKAHGHGHSLPAPSPDKSSGVSQHSQQSQPSPSSRSSKTTRTSAQACTPDSTPNSSTGGVQPVSPAVPSGNGGAEKDEAGHPSTYYGDLNPEAILMEATSLCSRRDVSAPGGVGIWQAPIPPRPSTRDLSVPSVQSSSRRAVQDMLRSYLWNHCLPCRAPAPDYAVLRRIYFEKMNAIFPIFEDPSVSSAPDEPTDILVQQVVSLAAAADPEATQHLRVSPNGPLLSRQEFCACLSNSVLTTLDAGIVTDRVWLIRLSAALSLYTQPTNAEEADIPALLNSRAVHQMHTLGLQMAVDNGHQKKGMIQTIFCCLWALDRITSAFYGRACLIHERDVGWDLEECIQAQTPPFRLLLMIITLLDKVIGLYRPGTRANKPILIELPIFEQMIIDAEALRMTSSCLASLEIFYHSVAILSTQSPADVTSSAMPNPATNSRRSLAAERITSIIAEEFAGQLSYMPFIPYGVSLSLSVSYRKMRHSKVPMYRSRGKLAFRKNTLLLKSMDDMFWKSKTMVAMAEQVLNEMDKAVASLAQENGLADLSKRVEPGPQGERSGEVLPEEIRPLDLTQNATDGGGEWMLFDAAPDLDVFGHFDPTFDLGAVDAALEGNFDFGTSTNWFDWHQQWG
ncbi:putative fungal specific transcription factor [Rosellinia necatrix]|uniref:Putative fungal specific transcription factor n=1 Tax=Rosellinia necatrix TaxID=77044 RepID=A0A1S8AA08_ROSNE|nr:putative fungal specific transcription factor [Rosellinia necatrix]